MADGRALPVTHPELVAVDPPGRVIAVGMAEGGFETMDLLRVTSLKPRTNGKRRRKKSSR